MNKGLIVALCWLIIASALQAQENQSENVKQRVASNSNNLRVIQLDDGALGNAFAIHLNDQLVMKTGGEEHQSGFRFHAFPFPDVILHITAELPPFQEVFVVQQRMWGNACDGGPIWFLGVKADGTFSVSDPVDYCGGPPPIFTVTSEKVTITDQGHAPNRGAAFIPEDVWVYQDGKVNQRQQPKRRKK